MDSVDKLRELKTFGSVSVDGDLVAAKMLMACATMEEINEIADEIEAEIEERYMKLPVDVNNEPVHIGDEMEHRSKHETLDVIAVGNDSFFTGHWADNYVRCIEVSAEWHHVKPRTLENVLREMVGMTDQPLCEEDIKAFADEIRELLLDGDE